MFGHTPQLPPVQSEAKAEEFIILSLFNQAAFISEGNHGACFFITAFWLLQHLTSSSRNIQELIAAEKNKLNFINENRAEIMKLQDAMTARMKGSRHIPTQFNSDEFINSLGEQVEAIVC